MKLTELIREAHKGHETDFKKIDFIGEDEGLLPFNVTVTYDYEPASYSKHPYGEGSATEHHSPVVGIVRIVTDSPVEQRDIKDNIIRTWPKGTDVKRLPGWKDDHLKWFEDEIAERDH